VVYKRGITLITVEAADLFQNVSTEELRCNSSLPCRNKKYAKLPNPPYLCSAQKKYKIRKLFKDKTGKETKQS